MRDIPAETFELEDIHHVCGFAYGECYNRDRLCFECSRNVSDPAKRKAGGYGDRWEPEEARRADGLVVCDLCGRVNKISASQCRKCKHQFPVEWQSLPKVEVPPLLAVFICTFCRFVNDHDGPCDHCGHYFEDGRGWVPAAAYEGGAGSLKIITDIKEMLTLS